MDNRPGQACNLSTTIAARLIGVICGSVLCCGTKAGNISWIMPYITTEVRGNFADAQILFWLVTISDRIFVTDDARLPVPDFLYFGGISQREQINKKLFPHIYSTAVHTVETKFEKYIFQIFNFELRVRS